VSYEDALGLFGNASLSMEVNAPLTGRFLYTPSGSPVVPGTTINFTADPAGGTPSYNVTWSFGDGLHAYGTAVSHAFSSPGLYDVRVQMTDAAGASRNDSLNITVNAPSGSPSIFSGNFGPGLGLGLLVGATVAAVLLSAAERMRRRRLPGPPSPYVPPSASSGKGRA
jgi:PKD repeat protein